MADTRILMRRFFNDGEGLDFKDLLDIQEWLIYEKRMFGNPSILDLGAGPGELGYNLGSSPYEGVSQGTLKYGSSNGNPFAFINGPVGPKVTDDGTTWSLAASYGTQWAQRRQASATGTPPNGVTDVDRRPEGTLADDYFNPMVYISGGDPLAALDNTTNPITNPRIDSIGVRLNFVDGKSLSRDFEDASTRAKTTQNQQKEIGIELESEIVQGTEAASPVAPAHTTGFSRVATIQRSVGQTFPIPITQVEAHWMPMRIGVEWQSGDNGWGIPTDWDLQSSVAGAEMSARKSNTNASPLYFMPRNMPVWARLIGFGINVNGTGNDNDITIGAFNQSRTFISNEQLGGGSPIALSAGTGFYFVGLNDFSVPHWGNGRAYGPLYDFRYDPANLAQLSPVQALSMFSRLAVKLGGTGDDFNAGELIYDVCFVYMY